MSHSVDPPASRSIVVVVVVVLSVIVVGPVPGGLGTYETAASRPRADEVSVTGAASVGPSRPPPSKGSARGAGPGRRRARWDADEGVASARSFADPGEGGIREGSRGPGWQERLRGIRSRRRAEAQRVGPSRRTTTTAMSRSPSLFLCLPFCLPLPLSLAILPSRSGRD